MNKRSWGVEAAFPWMGRQRFFEPGEVRLAILSLLTESPKHGYQLMKELQDFSGGLYTASAGSVYPTLQQLESELKQKPVLELSLYGDDLPSADAVQLTVDDKPASCVLGNEAGSQLELTCSVPPGTQKLAFVYSSPRLAIGNGWTLFSLSMYLREADGSCTGVQQSCSG